MKNFLFALIFVFAFASCAFASDDDVYVRKDVFEAKFDRVFDEFAKFHQDIDELKAGQKTLREEFSQMKTDIKVLSERVDRKTEALENQIRLMDNHVYYVLVMLGIILGIPFVQKILDFKIFKRQPQVTLDDVKRLIEESKHQA